MFSTIEDADLVLIGSDAPLPFDAEAITERARISSAVADDLTAIDCDDGYDVVARWHMDRDMLQQFTEGAERNTDDNMRIEYSAPLHLHEDTADANFLALLDDGGARRHLPVQSVSGKRGFVRLAKSYGDREDYIRALLSLKEADAIEPGDATVEALYVQYQEALKASLEAGEDEE